jgi:hypothetical protein
MMWYHYWAVFADPGTMGLTLPPITALYAACALLYAALSVLILARPPHSRTGLWLAAACLVTVAWCATAGADSYASLPAAVELMDIARMAA